MTPIDPISTFNSLRSLKSLNLSRTLSERSIFSSVGERNSVEKCIQPPVASAKLKMSACAPLPLAIRLHCFVAWLAHSLLHRFYINLLFKNSPYTKKTPLTTKRGLAPGARAALITLLKLVAIYTLFLSLAASADVNV